MEHCHECGAELINPKEHSDPMRRMFFASIRDVWHSMPDELKERFPSSETLRKTALVQVGWCDTTTEVYDSPEDAVKAAALAKRMDRFAVVQASGNVLHVHTARSMQKRSCPKKIFHDVADKALTWAAAQIGTTPEQMKGIAA